LNSPEEKEGQPFGTGRGKKYHAGKGGTKKCNYDVSRKKNQREPSDFSWSR